MENWRFYQGIRGEWRWYKLDRAGDVLAASDQGFSELSACMQNAESAGFDRHKGFQVHPQPSRTAEF